VPAVSGPTDDLAAADSANQPTSASGSGPTAGSDPSQGGSKDGGQDKPGGGGGALESPGARAGLGLGALLAVLLISVAALKAYGRLPTDSILRLTSSFTGGNGGNSGDSSFDRSLQPHEKFILPQDLSPAAVAAGEATAAAIGGLFAGFMRPGTGRVRPPQVITRTAQPEMLMALSELDASGGGGLNSSTKLSGGNSMSDAEADLYDDIQPNVAVAGVAGNVLPGMSSPGLLGADRRPKVDLIVCMDASGSLSWVEYRNVKEAFTRTGGLLDSVMSSAADGSRIAFVEYAYDSVVVSELDDNVDRVKRRVLSAFQGDANNWDRDSLYIYEVDEVYGGNALRKVKSLQGMLPSSSEGENSGSSGGRTGGSVSGIHSATKIGGSRRNKKVGSGNSSGRTSTPSPSGFDASVEYDMDGEEFVSIANACEVPPAMNGLSRDAYMALKWSRLEMLPPLANRELERKVEQANRLRRVLIVNAGEFTDGGSIDSGLSSSKEQVDEMESRGIAVITLGIGCLQDPGLESLATGDPAAHFSVETTAGVDPIMPDVIHMILSPRFQPSKSKLVQEPARLFFRSNRFAKSARTKSGSGKSGSKLRNIKARLSPKSRPVRNVRSMDSLDDDAIIDVIVPSFTPPRLSEGRLFMQESDAPPWFAVPA
jgi:hypothetical protein